jgi:hypothetical protein
MELTQMRDYIEKMTRFNQIEVLRILNGHDDVTINENRYGIHVNLSDLSEDVIEKLVSFVSYVNTQEKVLNQDEKEKEEIKNNYFS